MPRHAQSQPRLREAMTLQGVWPADTLTLVTHRLQTASLQNTVHINFCYFKPLQISVGLGIYYFLLYETETKYERIHFYPSSSFLGSVLALGSMHAQSPLEICALCMYVGWG